MQGKCRVNAVVVFYGPVHSVVEKLVIKYRVSYGIAVFSIASFQRHPATTWTYYTVACTSHMIEVKCNDRYIQGGPN